MYFTLQIGSDPIAAAITIAVLCLTFLIFLRMKYKRKSAAAVVPPMLKEPMEGSHMKSRETVRLARED